MEWEKQLHQLADRLTYIKDIFPGKHAEEIGTLETRLSEARTRLESCTEISNSNSSIIVSMIHRNTLLRNVRKGIQHILLR